MEPQKITPKTLDNQLNRDVLRLIFALADKQTVLSLRLVCKSFNDQLKSRLTIFHANDYLKVMPLTCDTLICNALMKNAPELPQINHDLKKAVVYDTGCHWTRNVDTLFIYTAADYISPRIQCNVNNLVLGIAAYEMTSTQVVEDITLDTFLDEHNYYYSTYCSIYLTSHYPCRVNTRGVRIVYLLPGTVIKRLLVGVAKLHLIDLEATIDEIYVLNNKNDNTRVFIYKNKDRRTHTYEDRLVKLDPSIWK